MIKCKGNRVKVKGNEAQIAIELLALIRSLDACAPGVLDAVKVLTVLEQTLGNAEIPEVEEAENDVNS